MVKAHNALVWIDQEIIIPIRVRIYGRRPQPEVLANLRASLEAEPASKEIHEMLAVLDKVFPPPGGDA